MKKMAYKNEQILRSVAEIRYFCSKSMIYSNVFGQNIKNNRDLNDRHYNML